MKVDYLIVGQGLAGSLLAWELIKREKKIIVVDNGAHNASHVAAGIVNPITGQRFVKAADVATLLPAARSYYAGLAAAFNRTWLVDLPMRRIFRTQAENEQCRQRLNQTDYLPYLGEFHPQARQARPFKTPHGYIDQKQTCRLQIADLLACLRAWLKANNSYRQGIFVYPEPAANQRVHWQDIAAERIIFCEGYQGASNPWFSWLPFKPAKGEILSLAYSALLPQMMVNFGHWLVPASEHSLRLGATFEWLFSDALPSENGKRSLLAALAEIEMEPQSHHLIAHEAGIRPCTEDRQPFIGLHPADPRIGIFNGFGAKGSLQTPWYAQRFADFLTRHQPLPLNCDIKRYQRRFLAA